jgi:carboxyl-terminal processing protease
VPAQAPALLSPDAAAGLAEEAFTLIRDNALTAPDTTAVLRAALAGARQVLTNAGIIPPPLPVLNGSAGDLPAVVAYVRTAGALYQPQSLDVLTVVVLRSMIRETGDPLGAIFLPADFARFIAVLRGERGGVGLQVDALPAGMTVIELIEAGPAARSGVLVGDVITDVDGAAVRGRTPDQVMEMLGGRVESAVILGLSRGGQFLRVPVTREQVRTIPVRARMIESRIGYIRLLEFSEGSAKDIARALERVLAAGAGAVLLDLRSNGGGLVDDAVDIASHFLPVGLVAVEERRAGPLMLLVQPATPRFQGPMAVLVNGGSASASEIVAGALQDVGAPLVGARTYGKGTVQTIYTLDADWGLRLTTARYRTRAGRAVDGVGLPPDVVVLMSAAQVQATDDTQMGAALQLLRSRLQSARSP